MANRVSRRVIARIAEEKGLESCEIRFQGCMGTFGVAPAHRHNRDWYKGDAELLSDFSQWLCACQACHQILDNRSKTTEAQVEEIFNELRP